MRRHWYLIISGWIMLGILALFFGMFLATKAHAQEPTGSATLTWTPPTQNEDGTAYTNYGGFKIYYGPPSAPLGYTIDLPDTTNTLNTYVVDNLVYGDWHFAMTAYNSNGTESRLSNTAIKTVGATPEPPDLTFVTIETIVYNVVKRDNGFALIAVGNVPLNTPCDISQSVNGKYAVPVASVTWLGSVEPIVVVATCSEN